nr:odorant receptor 24 [Papilio xuthus]
MKSSFDGFKPHFKYLVLTGCYKMLDRPTSKIKVTLYACYRIFVTVTFFIFLLQHVIRLIQAIEEVINTLYVFLTLLNSVCKMLILNIRSERIEHIVEVIKGPIFAARNKYQEELVHRNAVSMLRVLRTDLGVSMFCSVLWMIFPLMIRLSGQEVRFSMYFPFETDKFPVFISVVVYVGSIVHWVSLFTLSIDCIVVSLYMQAQLQLQMLRDNLTHLADVEDDDENDKLTVKMYRDVEKIRFKDLFYRRLVMCKKRQELIVWLVDEIESIFGTPMVLQMLVMAWIICMTIYKIAAINILSVECLAMVVYLNCVLFQLFIYCYFGTQLKYESEYVNQSIYECDWPAVSPRLRRPLLIMMERCYRPIAPCIAYVVPMSLDTFISVVKFSYSLYTFLDRK